MNFLGNFLWFITGGILTSFMWLLLGIFYSITVIGIPFALQAFKMAHLSVFPFGKKVEYTYGGAGRFIGNVIWFIFGGLELAIANFILCIIFSVTIIGIPFGKQYFKLTKLSLTPFGVTIVKV